MKKQKYGSAYSPANRAQPGTRDLDLIGAQLSNGEKGLKFLDAYPLNRRSAELLHAYICEVLEDDSNTVEFNAIPTDGAEIKDNLKLLFYVFASTPVCRLPTCQWQIAVNRRFATKPVQAIRSDPYPSEKLRLQSFMFMDLDIERFQSTKLHELARVHLDWLELNNGTRSYIFVF